LAHRFLSHHGQFRLPFLGFAFLGELEFELLDFERANA
jgi:hypothetical protein